MAQGDGKTPGTGSNNPFGNGMGSVSGTRAAPFDMNAQQNPQRPRGADPSMQQIIGDGILRADPNGGGIRTAQIGTIAATNRPPFSLKG